MLHIRFDNKGRTTYCFSKPTVKHVDEQVRNTCTIPKLPVPPHKQRVDLDYWKRNNEQNIEKATSFILEGLQTFLSSNPHYNCALNLENFESDLHKVLHKSSHNALKQYMRPTFYLS